MKKVSVKCFLILHSWKNMENRIEFISGWRIIKSCREEIVSALSLPIRKGAHVTEYIVLCISLLTAFYVSGVRKCTLEKPDGIVECPRGNTIEKPDSIRGCLSGYKWIVSSMIVTFLYACTDEFHQTFVPGRAGRFTDVLIDCTGALVLCILVTFVQRRRMHVKR